jgi:hypothetical protein
MDVKLGRQILTWGTGDLLFVNDLFPKDWRAFFTGRDVEYLKAPSDALLVSMFPRFANIDVAITPRFDHDRYIRGERISYWNPLLGRIAGRDAVVDPITPDEEELALRVYRTYRGFELAAYAYDGFWKSPRGFDASSFRADFQPLTVLGASARGPLGKGILSFEVGHYDSRDDSTGDNPFVPNAELRVLIGYEREIAKELTAAVQYYQERMRDHHAYLSSLPEGMPAAAKNRDVITLRLTKLAMSQNLTLSAFTYVSPADEDGYTRPSVTYKLDDHWRVNGGANFFWGADDHSFFGQFEDASNLYAGARYSF